MLPRLASGACLVAFASCANACSSTDAGGTPNDAATETSALDSVVVDEGADTSEDDSSTAAETSADTSDDSIDTSSSADTHVDAAVDTTPPPGGCNMLAPAPLATTSTVIGAIPTPLGGSVVDGDYSLTDIATYLTSGTPSSMPGSVSERMVVTGATAQIVLQLGATGTPDRGIVAVTTTGNTLHLTPTCGTLSPDPDTGYTASSTSLVVYIHSGGLTQGFVFTRKP
ncbi:MAG: hypothetical protein ACXWP4_08820 [Polyangiales bacterium]